MPPTDKGRPPRPLPGFEHFFAAPDAPRKEPDMPTLRKTNTAAEIAIERAAWAAWLAERPAGARWRVGLPPDPPFGVTRPALTNVLEDIAGFRRQVAAIQRARQEERSRYCVVIMPHPAANGGGWQVLPLPLADTIQTAGERERAIGGATGRPGMVAWFDDGASARREAARWARRYPENRYRVARVELLEDEP